jgi:hypothetical protein
MAIFCVEGLFMKGKLYSMHSSHNGKKCKRSALEFSLEKLDDTKKLDGADETEVELEW